MTSTSRTVDDDERQFSGCFGRCFFGLRRPSQRSRRTSVISNRVGADDSDETERRERRTTMATENDRTPSVVGDSEGDNDDSCYGSTVNVQQRRRLGSDNRSVVVVVMSSSDGVGGSESVSQSSSSSTVDRCHRRRLDDNVDGGGQCSGTAVPPLDVDHDQRQTVRTEVDDDTDDDEGTARTKSGVILSDDDEFYSQEKEEILDHMKSARYQIEAQKRRQSVILRQRKSQYQSPEQRANSVLHRAEVADRLKSKEHERQRKLIKNRVDDRKRRADLHLTDAKPSTSSTSATDE